MAATELNKYIEKRYQRWLDYSEYHCSIVGMTDEASDILNEVILALLQKDEAKVTKMMNSKKGQYTELDFYVLRMIKLNVHSGTSPYQSHYKAIPCDNNTDLRRINIEDMQDDGEDVPGMILERFKQVREVFESLNLSEQAKRVFEFKFFQDQSLSRWSGPESRKELYDIYSQVIKLIKEKINGKTLI